MFDNVKKASLGKKYTPERVEALVKIADKAVDKMTEGKVRPIITVAAFQSSI